MLIEFTNGLDGNKIAINPVDVSSITVSQENNDETKPKYTWIFVGQTSYYLSEAYEDVVKAIQNASEAK
jgi:hypothetical protein